MAEVEQAPADVRQRLAESLCQWLAEQAFGLQRLHTDPHPGNLAWTERGELVVYDFGSVLRLEPRLLAGYVQIFERCAARPARRSRRASRCSADVSLAACRRTGCIGAST